MEIVNINKFNRKSLKIEKDNGKIITKYNDNQIIIEPSIAFDNCTINQDKNPYRIRSNIDIIKENILNLKMF